MTADTPDPLLARVRAADPLGERALRTDLDRPRADAARRRHASRRLRRLGASGCMLALAATLAFALAPSSGPDGSTILVRAVQASEPPPNSILAVVADESLNGQTVRFHTWVRTSATGRLLDTRLFRTSTSRRFRAMDGEDRVDHLNAQGVRILQAYDPRTKRILTGRNHVDVLALFGQYRIDAHQLLARAHKLGQHVDVGARVARAGRAVYPVRLGSAIGPGHVRIAGGRMLIDAATYKPVEFSTTVQGTTYTERVVSEHVLPDTPQNRRFLRMHGPTQ